MDKQQVTYVCAMISRLEWFLNNSRSLLADNPKANHTKLHQLQEYARVIKQMKKAATNLQFAVAREDYERALREIRVAYGLNQMVSGHLISLFVSLSNANHDGQGAREFAPIELTCH